jgi:hypothetical protein
VSITAGTDIDGSLSVRYGGKFKEDNFYRVYTKGFRIDDFGYDSSNRDANDE